MHVWTSVILDQSLRHMQSQTYVYVACLGHNAQCRTHVWCEMFLCHVHVRLCDVTITSAGQVLGCRQCTCVVWNSVTDVSCNSRVMSHCSAICLQQINMSLLVVLHFLHRCLQLCISLLQLLLRPDHFICLLVHCSGYGL